MAVLSKPVRAVEISEKVTGTEPFPLYVALKMLDVQIPNITLEEHLHHANRLLMKSCVYLGHILQKYRHGELRLSKPEAKLWWNRQENANDSDKYASTIRQAALAVAKAYPEQDLARAKLLGKLTFMVLEACVLHELLSMASMDRTDALRAEFRRLKELIPHGAQARAKYYKDLKSRGHKTLAVKPEFVQRCAELSNDENDRWRDEAIYYFKKHLDFLKGIDRDFSNKEKLIGTISVLYDEVNTHYNVEHHDHKVQFQDVAAVFQAQGTPIEGSVLPIFRLIGRPGPRPWNWVREVTHS